MLLSQWQHNFDELLLVLINCVSLGIYTHTQKVARNELAKTLPIMKPLTEVEEIMT